MGAVEQYRFPEDAVIRGKDLNRVLDQILGSDGGQWKFVGWDGVLRNPDTGATLSTGNYSHIVQSAAGNHFAVLLLATALDAVPTLANSVLLVNNAALSIASGKELRIWNAAGNNPVTFYHSGTNDIGKTDDSWWIVKALGVGISPSGLADGEILASGDIGFQSGQGVAVTFRHAATGARDVSFQDLSGYAALLGAANNAGHLLFLDNSYDIGALGATRPRNLYLAGTAIIGGGMAGHLLFTPDNTYDIGASGATRPRNLYLAGVAVLGGGMGGHLLFTPDATYDIGASGATRPRDLHLSRAAVVGTTLTVGTTLVLGTDGINTNASVGVATHLMHSGGAGAPAYWGPLTAAEVPATSQIGSATGTTSNPTRALTTYATLDEMTVTLTSTGGALKAEFSGTFYNSAGALGNLVVGFSLDGATEVCEREHTPTALNALFTISMQKAFNGVAAGSHTITVRWKVGAGTITSRLTYRDLIVTEIKV